MNKLPLLLSIICSILIYSHRPLEAQMIRYVSPTGTNLSNNCGEEEIPCRSIQQAVEQSNPQDHISLASGIYTEAGITIDKALMIRGKDQANTIVQADRMPNIALDRVFTIQGGVQVILEGITIQHGKSPVEDYEGLPGGGIFCEGELTLRHCTVKENRTGSDEFEDELSGDGGGVYCDGKLTLEYTTVIQNRTLDTFSLSGSGGGIYCQGELRIEDSSILQNETGEAFDDTGSGGGIYCQGELQILRSIIDENKIGFGGTTPGSGGGIYFESGNGVIKESRITDNAIEEDFFKGGGGLGNAGELSLEECIISGNSVGDNGSGGGIYNDHILTINRCTIEENNLESYTLGAGIYNSPSGQLTLNHSTVAKNLTLDSGHGGGVANDGILLVNHTTISDNRVGSGETSGMGGGIYNSGEAILVNSTLSGNRTSDDSFEAGSGGGIANVGEGTTLTLRHCTLTKNKVGISQVSQSGGHGGGIFNEEAEVLLSHTIIADNEASEREEGNDCFGIIQPQGFNLIGDPRGCTLAGEEQQDLLGIGARLGPLQDHGGATLTHALLHDSPAINAGDPAFMPPPDTDQRGKPRVARGRIDIGAFELSTIPILERATNPANGHLYVLLDNSNWTDAQATAQSLGGNLATINNQAEQDWIWSKWGGGSEANGLWIGLNDLTMAGTPIWSSGAPISFTLWGPDEPTQEERETVVALWGDYDGGWNDLQDAPTATPSKVPLFGVVEVSRSIGFSQTQSSVSEGMSVVEIEVILSQDPSSAPASASYQVTGGTASEEDYLISEGTLEFTPPALSQTIRIQLKDDDLAEEAETIRISLSDPFLALLDPQSDHTLTILDNDSLFKAYNDLSWNSGQISANITRFTTEEGIGNPPQGSSGLLVDYATGKPTSVTLTVGGGNWNGTTHTLQGALSEPGTEAYNWLEGIVDAQGVISYGQSDIVLSLKGLNPTTRYRVTLFGNRHQPRYQDRITKTTLTKATAFKNESTPGAAFSGPRSPSTRIVHGMNTERGYLTRFTDIIPNLQGEIEIRVTDGGSSDGHHPYVNALSCEALGPKVAFDPIYILNAPSTSSEGDDSIVGFNAFGNLQNFVPPDPDLNGLREIAFSPDGATLYALQASFPENQYRILFFDATGTLVDQIKIANTDSLNSMTVASNGLIYVAGSFPSNTGLLEVNPRSKSARIFSTFGERFAIGDITQDSLGNFFLTGEDANFDEAIYKVDLQGNFTIFADSSDGLDGPSGITYDPMSDRIWVINDRDPNEIYSFDLSGEGELYTTLPDLFFFPDTQSILIDHDGLPLVPLADLEELDKVVKVNSSGETTDIYTEGLHWPVDLKFSPSPPSSFIAYNDLSWGRGQLSQNITRYTTVNGPGRPPEGHQGPLVDQATGRQLPFTLTVTGGRWNGTTHTTFGALSEKGTEAYESYIDKVDATGVLSYGDEPILLSFTNLDPNGLYFIELFGNRDQPEYTDRITEARITGADSAVNASSVGARFEGPDDPATFIVHGYNREEGYVIRFTHIEPGDDGTVEIIVSDGGSKNPSAPYLNVLRFEALLLNEVP